MTKFNEKFFNVCSENFEPVSESMSNALNSGIIEGIISYIKDNPSGVLKLPCGNFEMSPEGISFNPRKEFINGIEKTNSIDSVFLDEGTIISENADLIRRITDVIRGNDKGGGNVIAFAITDSEVAFLLNIWSEALRKALSFGCKSGKIYEITIEKLGTFSIVMDGDSASVSFDADKSLKQLSKNDAAM